MRRALLLLLLLLSWPATAQDTVTTEVLSKGYGPKLEEGQRATISFQLETSKKLSIENRSEREPLKFIVGDQAFLPGLSQGVVGMQLQEVRRITVPPSLGYGAKEVGPIPPNSTLIFTVTLLEVEDVEDSEVPLSDRFKDDEFLDSRNANKIEKPAMFEYIIRDFFTKPWRYDDGYKKTLNDCGILAGVFVLLLAVFGIGAKKGFWSI